MHLIIAPDSFKESMSAEAAAQSIERGGRSVYGENAIIDIIPLADGGEGTIEALSTVMDLIKY